MEDEDGSTDAFCEVIVLVPWGEDCVFWRQPESSESSQYFHNWASKTLRDHLIFTLMEPVGLQLSSYEREGARGVSSFSTPSTNLRSLHLSWEVPSVQFVQSIQKNHILYQSTRHLQRSLGILFCWNFRFPKKNHQNTSGRSQWLKLPRNWFEISENSSVETPMVGAAVGPPWGLCSMECQLSMCQGAILDDLWCHMFYAKLMIR